MEGLAPLPSPSLAVSQSVLSPSPITDATEDVLISTKFFPDNQLTDVIIYTSDRVFFYVSFNRLMEKTSNNFNMLLSRERKSATESAAKVLRIPERSVVVNVVLHSVYNISCGEYFPTLQDLADALIALKIYGYSLADQVSPERPLFSTLLAHASTMPLELYALAASHDLFNLASATSASLLSISLPSITDAIAQTMGPIYLKRLMDLHVERVSALKQLLLTPPSVHEPTQACGKAEQASLTRAWALASAYLAWEAKPDMTAAIIEQTLQPLGSELSCPRCQTALADRTNSLIEEWGRVKATI